MNQLSYFTQPRSLLILILTFAFLVRLPALNQSLWLDEATTANVVNSLRMNHILSDYAPNDFHPPGYYLFMRGWVLLFGNSEVSLRMPSVLLSLVIGWFVYLITQQLQRITKNKAEHQSPYLPIGASALFLFNPLIVYYAQEARMYMMMTFFCTAGLYLFFDIFFTPHKGTPSSIWKSRTSRIALLNGCFIGGFLTFYGSVFFFASLCILLVLNRGWKELQFILPAPVVILLLGGPLLYTQLTYAQQALQLVPNWSLVLGTVTVKNLLLIPVKFSIGRIDFDPQIAYYGIAAVWTGVAMAIMLSGMVYETIRTLSSKPKQRLLPLMTFLFCTPLLLGMIFSLWTPLLQYFRFLYLIPIMAILMAFGMQYIQDLTTRKKHLLPPVLTRQKQYLPYFFTIIFLVFSLVYLFLPQFHREDWQALTNILKTANTPVYMVASAADPVRYYAPELKIEPLRDLQSEPLRAQEVHVVPYVADIHGIAYQDLLRQQRYRLAETIIVRGLSFEVWEKIEGYARD
jgi:uncharacterized membrane protein